MSTLRSSVSSTGPSSQLWQYQVAHVSSSLSSSQTGNTRSPSAPSDASAISSPEATTSSTGNASSSSSADTPSTTKQDTYEKGTSPSSSADHHTAADLQLIASLQARDAQVRAHEAAHQAAGGSLVGGASYSYQTGPDHKNYAIGGEVSVDTSPVSNNPAATIAKMRTVQAAALAPADPSAQDLHVAAQAAQISAQAAAELSKQQSAAAKPAEKSDEKKSTDDASGKADNAQSSTSTSSTSPSTTSSNTNASNDAASSQPSTQQRRGVDSYRQSIDTIVAQLTGSGVSASA